MMNKSWKGKKREIKEKMKNSINNYNWKEEIKADLECQVCNEMIDLENNLKCLNCN